MCIPTLYNYYNEGGVQTGLVAENSQFTLNNKNISIYSGAIHYFRVPQEYWRDRLRKLRAAGLNTVETYVPWNLHEPQPGVFDFGEGGTDFQKFLDIQKFLTIAKEEDLLAIVRPGPYICAEWEFGGLPSWLLRDKDLKIRTSNETFMGYARRFFSALLPLLTSLQFTKGGPIIAFQIENEYGNTKKANEDVDLNYLEELKRIYRLNGIVELLFTSDTPTNGFLGSLPDVLYTANFQEEPEKELQLLKGYQPTRPLMVMEYWTGWFDHWTDKHHTRANEIFSDIYERILNFPSSVNMYMFHGGTNWGFMNGGNIRDTSTDNGGYIPDTTSYDYDAPLSESGDYTDKYHTIKKLIAKYEKVKTRLPIVPPLIPKTIHEKVEFTQQLTLEKIITQAEHHLMSQNVIPMELLDINNNAGQSYGYIVYRKKHLYIPKNSILKIGGRVCDTSLIIINGKLISPILDKQTDLDGFGYWRAKDTSLSLGEEEYKNATLDIMVENWGRNNYGKLDQFLQHKGLWQGNVSLNGEDLFEWEIIPLEFKKKWTMALTDWQVPHLQTGPALYKGILNVKEKRDTFIDMRGWVKGIVIVNGFVLSRYLKFGPQQSAYLPAPLLKLGDNEVIIFEHFVSKGSVTFSLNPIFETVE